MTSTQIDTEHNGRDPSRLRAALESLGGSLKDWTVMADHRDPFRLDTPTNHVVGAWLRETWDRLNIKKPIRLRGIHYAILGQPKPQVNGANCSSWSPTSPPKRTTGLLPMPPSSSNGPATF